MEQNSESSIIERARQGDQDAISRLYNETKNYAYFVAQRYLQNDEDIADVLQEAYIAVFSKLDTFEDGKPFKPWLHAIVTNKCLNFIKSRRAVFVSVDEIAELVGDDEEIIPAAWLERAEKRRDILRIIDGLPEGQRMAVTLFYFEGLSISDMAGIMGVAEGTVKAHLYFGRKAIKEEVLREEEKGNKLYAIVPLPLLTQLFELEAETAVMPEAMSQKIWKGTLQELASNGVVTGSAAANAPAAAAGAAKTGMALATKIIIGVVAAAVVTAGAVFLPPLLNAPDETTPPGVTDNRPDESNLEAEASTPGGDNETPGQTDTETSGGAETEEPSSPDVENETFIDDGPTADWKPAQVVGNLNGNVSSRMRGEIVPLGEYICSYGRLYDAAGNFISYISEQGDPGIAGSIGGCAYLNTVDGWIYGISYNAEEYSHIIKVNTQFTEKIVFPLDEGRYIGSMRVEDDWIYYHERDYAGTESGNLYKMKTDGTQKTIFPEVKTEEFTIENGWIYYIDFDAMNLYKIRTDGTGNQPVNPELWFGQWPLVYDGWVYFNHNLIGGSNQIARVRIDGTGYMVLFPDYNSAFNVADGIIYYIKTTGLNAEEVSLCMANADGTNEKLIFNYPPDGRIYIAGDFVWFNAYINDSLETLRVRRDGTGIEISDWQGVYRAFSK